MYKVPGTVSGENTFSLIDWTTGTGGEWLNWAISNSNLQSSQSDTPNCEALGVIEHTLGKDFLIYPNPATKEIAIHITDEISYVIYNLMGAEVSRGRITTGSSNNIENLPVGVYIFTIEGSEEIEQFVKL